MSWIEPMYVARDSHFYVWYPWFRSNFRKHAQVLFVSSSAYTVQECRVFAVISIAPLKLSWFRTGKQELSWATGHTDNVFQARTIGTGDDTLVSCAADGQVRFFRTRSKYVVCTNVPRNIRRCKIIGLSEIKN